MFSQGLALLALLATSTHAHMILRFPMPYGNHTINNSPLGPNGEDFPCKQRPGVYDVVEMNTWKVGEPQKVGFWGGATHGGGSCQFSLTTDQQPDKNSQWKVIHSIIGNCPSDNPANLSEDFAERGSNNYTVTLPKDLPEGQYTFAWTWINKLGNREFYMNCAPLKVVNTNAQAKDVNAALGKLPDMFVANMPNTTCGIGYGQDFVYPNPGESVEYGTNGTKTGSLLDPSMGCASVTLIGKGAGKIGSPAQATGGAGGHSSAVANPPAATSAAASNPGGVFAPSASSGAGGGVQSTTTSFTTLIVTATGEPPAATSVASAPVTSQAPAVSQAPAASQAPSSGDKVACSNEGGIVCIGTSQFGLCDHGYAVPQALAAGTACTNNSITRRSYRHRVRSHRRHGSEMI